MLFLTNEHVQAVLDMPTCLQVMEEAYRELAEQRAGYRPRLDFYVPQTPHFYRWGTMEGVSRRLGVFAIRMKSDMLVWNREGEFQTEEKYCIRPGTYCGLIFLLSVRNAEPLALMNDGYLQHMRVGACAGLGAQYLARQDSQVLGLLGSGGMARTYALAIREVRPIRRIQVFSPTKANRERYAGEMGERLGLEVEPVEAPEKAVRGADIVALTTDSLVPVIKADWLEPGMHITNVRSNEAGRDVLARVDVIARLGSATLRMDPPPPGTLAGSDGMFAYFAGTAEERARVPRSPSREIDNPSVGTIPDLMAGRWPGRTDDRQITFLNNQGTQGLQFAAVGAKVYELARARGLGHPIPTEWFMQDIRD
ncbi:MAG: ornithine cyclodeaminase family protein [Deltaproteobacteria bacterium]|nr:ornithine cyclodeaminase family protein [Deltaproteobacteria bacterium]